MSLPPRAPGPTPNAKVTDEVVQVHLTGLLSFRTAFIDGKKEDIVKVVVAAYYTMLFISILRSKFHVLIHDYV